MTIERRVEFIIQSIESHGRQIGENTQHIAELRANIDLLVQVSNRDADAIRALTRVAQSRDRRIEDLETGRG